MITLLLVAFLLELVAFFSIGALALLVEANTIIQVVLYIVLFSLVIIFWGIYMSPKAPKQLLGRTYYVAKAVVYLIAALSLVLTFNLMVGMLFIVFWVADDALIHLLQRRTRDNKIN